MKRMCWWSAPALVAWRRHWAPREVRNLLVAGRATGGDRISHAATRNMMCCTVTGQGAGVGAAISVKQNLPPQELDVGLIQAELKRPDVRLA